MLPASCISVHFTSCSTLDTSTIQPAKPSAPPHNHTLNMTIMLALAYLIITATRIQNTTAESTIRQNVGIIYEQLPGQIITGHDKHRLILAIPYTIPTPPSPKPHIAPVIQQLQLTTISAHTSHYYKLLQQAKDLDTLITNIDANIALSMTNIEHFLADPINSRQARAILGFLGEICKSIFGLVTQSDMDKILAAVHEIDSKLRDTSNLGLNTAQAIADIINKQDSFVNTYIQDTATFDSVLYNITASLDSWSNNFTTSLSSLSETTNRDATQTAIISAQTLILLSRLAYQDGLSSIENSLRLLSTGTLAPDMIRPAELAVKLQELDNHLKITNPGSSVTVMSTAYYYSQPVALYTYSTTHLYIHIDVIISATDAAFTIYQIVKTPVPINTEETNSTGVTVLDSDVKFLAANDKLSLFLEMTTADLMTCQGPILKICSRTIPRIRLDNPTCHMAIFTNNNLLIKQRCNFHVLPFMPITTTAIAIDRNKYLITTNEPNYHIICQHFTPSQHPTKAYSIITVPCLCHLQFKQLYLPNTELPCNSSKTTHYLMHTANLPIINSLTTENNRVTSDSQHIDAIHIPALNTNALMRLLPSANNIPKDMKMDLKPFANILLSDAKEANRIINAPRDSHPAHSPLSAEPWIYIAPVLSIINSIVVVYLVMKGLGRTAFLTAIPSAAAAPVNFTWRALPMPHPSARTESSSPHLTSYITTENMAFIIISAIIIYTIIRTAKSCRSCITKHLGLVTESHRTNPTITLKIYNGKINHTVPLIIVPFEMDVISGGTAPTLIDIHATSCPIPAITMHWSGPMTININNKPTTFYLPNQITLPLKCRFTIITALKDKTTSTAVIMKGPNNTARSMLTSNSDDTSSSRDQDNTENTPLARRNSQLTTHELIMSLFRPSTNVDNES